ncbi:hypothetical protein OFO07_07490 [Campylobacter sp. JMF_06 NA1]|uniref:hypothetical protein n=1 Tax=Campylobacter sp. JMF_06 NA1 TaxID=2983823 RepID=UPI0022E9C87A|nr:hypothetical protein [Campylobacter sp. JMF_06 NA1]MDA3078757.1 hypothetical protein [Campylobacter sp. JMF_06 NA1]
MELFLKCIVDLLFSTYSMYVMINSDDKINIIIMPNEITPLIVSYLSNKLLILSAIVNANKNGNINRL